MKKFASDILMIFPIIGGICAVAVILAAPSEQKNALLFGLSGFRLCMVMFTIGFTVFAFLVYRKGRKMQTFLYYFCALSGVTAAEILLFSRFPTDDSRNLIPIIADRAGPLLWCVLLSSLFWYLSLRLSGTNFPRHFGFTMAFAAILVYWLISEHMAKICWNVRLDGNTTICVLVMISLVLWQLALDSSIHRGWKTAAGCLFFVLLGFGVTRITGMWMGRVETPPKAYWNELAESFLNGRLDLMHPTVFHDLTQYKGKWYVPNPPLPGILLIPWVAILESAEAVNTCVYSAVIAGLNAGLFYLMILLAFTREGSPFYSPVSDEASFPPNSLNIAAWVTILFVFGTDHLWLGTTGQMWFISQLLVVTFTLLAVICVLCSFSPVCAGISLAFGMLCRPNIFPIWLCLLGLWLYQERPFPSVNRRKTIRWCLLSGIPVVISVLLQLLYNKLRFDSWLDFGYVTINGADWILEAVQKYGMFHPHFIRINADVMLFGLPELDFSGTRFFFQPHVAGYSIFLMTPPIIFIFRAFRKNWFSIGAWASVLLSIALLLLYHNTGAEQIGYRYLLDFSAPLSLLIVDGVRGKTELLFKILTIFAIVLSFTAIYWWYLGRV